ncbi:hypothetical protein D3OALGB2SA_996 [Olavius algarvensis associated proteobacterium Delta 3]|nr:hypothetical protein D3OALGB2SA_996 [Olavius algarvensis associated proteobacterium Delta 3]
MVKELTAYKFFSFLSLKFQFFRFLSEYKHSTEHMKIGTAPLNVFMRVGTRNTTGFHPVRFPSG